MILVKHFHKIQVLLKNRESRKRYLSFQNQILSKWKRDTELMNKTIMNLTIITIIIID